jgi:hypothetical protein
MRLRMCAMAAFACFMLSICAHGDTIAEFTGGTGAINLTTYDGQSFLVLGSGSYTNISFNFYDPSGDPYAIGTAYLFSIPYSGTPAGLSSAAGALGSATASNGTYAFSSAVILTAGQTYYLFEDTAIPTGAIVGAFLSTPSFFQSAGKNDSFGAVDGSANFLVTGDPFEVGAAPTPEPSSLILLVTGALGFVTVLRVRSCTRTN